MGQGERLEASVGPAEGGVASLRALQRFFTLLFSTPCYLLAEVRRIDEQSPAADPGRGNDKQDTNFFWLKQGQVINILTCCDERWLQADRENLWL